MNMSTHRAGTNYRHVFSFWLPPANTLIWALQIQHLANYSIILLNRSTIRSQKNLLARDLSHAPCTDLTQTRNLPRPKLLRSDIYQDRIFRNFENFKWSTIFWNSNRSMNCEGSLIYRKCLHKNSNVVLLISAKEQTTWYLLNLKNVCRKIGLSYQSENPDHNLRE